MKVHNINGTSRNKCKCGTWKKHWEDFNENGDPWPSECVEISCKRTASDGAHVQKEEGKDKSWYIIPLCDVHNGPKFHGETIEIDNDTSFASANRSETCEKANSK